MEELVHLELEFAWQHAGTSAADALIRALTAEDKEIRLAAVGAIGELGIPRAAPQIKALLTDDVVEVRLRAAAVLGRFGDDSGLLIVLHFLEQDSHCSALFGDASLYSSHGERDWR